MDFDLGLIPTDDLKGGVKPGKGLGIGIDQAAVFEKQQTDALSRPCHDGAGFPVKLKELQERGERHAGDLPLGARGQAILDFLEEQLEINRFFDVLKGPQVHEPIFHLRGAESGHGNDRHGILQPAHPADQLKPVHFRHLQVGDHQINRLRGKDRQGLLAVARGNDLE